MIVNLTPHAITIRDSGGGVLHDIPPTGQIARALEQVTQANSPIDGIRTTYVYPTGIDGLPDPVVGTFYIVSLVAAEAAFLAGRATHDLLIPGQQTRDEAGQINGCASLVRYQPLHERVSPTILWQIAQKILAQAAACDAQDQLGMSVGAAHLPLEQVKAAFLIAVDLVIGVTLDVKNLATRAAERAAELAATSKDMVGMRWVPAFTLNPDGTVTP